MTFKFILAFASFVFASSAVGAQSTSDTPNSKGPSQVRTKAAQLDYKTLVKSLENRNRQPTIMGDIPDQWPLFPKDYDWAEQKRVLAVMQTLVDHAEEAWPLLIDYLDDAHYCITFEHDQSVAHYSVGRICNVILLKNLTAAHMQYCPAEKIAFGRLSRPSIIPFDRFKSWCRKQHDEGKKLYELQVIMCEWAIKEVPKLKYSSDEEKTASIAGIQSQIEELRKTKKAVRIDRITGESRAPYSQERADGIRDRYENRKRKQSAD